MLPGRVDEFRMFRCRLQHEQVAQLRDEIEREPAQIMPLVDEPRDRREQPREVGLDQSVHHLSDGRTGRRPEDLRDMIDGDLAAGEREDLLEDRQRVAYRPVTGAHDSIDRSRIDGGALGGHDAHDMRSHILGVDTAQVEPLHARQDRRQDLLRVGRRHGEQHMPGWFLDELQQRVERSRRGHVHLIEDVDLPPPRRRGELGPLTQVTRVVHTAMRSHVELDDIERGPCGDGHARLARTAR